MGLVRSFVRALALAAIVVILLVALPVGAAFAQTPSPSPTTTGICSPWHRCLALGVLGFVVLYLGFIGLNFAIQRRGFDSLEHRMGNPDGVPAEKK